MQVWRCGPSKNNLEFLAETRRAYFMERPVGEVGHDRAWNYLLYRGDENFDAGKSELLRIVRDQAEANVRFIRPGDRPFMTLEWNGKGDVGGLAAAPKQHEFSWNGQKYQWDEQSHLTGNDFVCKDLATRQTVAYFRSVMTPQTKEGKLEITRQADQDFQDILVATCIAYREWAIRRQLLLYGDTWFNQSVTG